MKSLFDAEAYSKTRNRIDGLSENSEKQWGKMTVGQMLHHCQGPFNIMLEKKDYGQKPNLLAKIFFKKIRTAKMKIKKLHYFRILIVYFHF